MSTEECPGGNKSWEVFLRTDAAVVCKEEVDLCQHDNGNAFYHTDQFVLDF